MKKIIIKPENRQRINDALKKINGRATAHAITDAYDVEVIVQNVEQAYVQRGATKKSLIGTQITFAPPGPGKAYAKSGKRVITTRLTLERGATNWALVGIERDMIWADSMGEHFVALPEAAIRKLAEAALGDLNLLGERTRPFSSLLHQALNIATMLRQSAHEKIAILKELGL